MMFISMGKDVVALNVDDSGESDPCGAQVFRVLGETESKWILCLITYNTVIIYYLCGWVTSTNSIALNAYVNTVFFNLLSLSVCLVSIWVSRKTPATEKFAESWNKSSGTSLGHPNKSNHVVIDQTVSLSCLGPEKYEVLALLVSSCLVLFGGSLISMEIFLRVSDQPSVHTGRLGLGALLGLLAHLGTILVYPDAGLNHVVCMALPCATFRECNPILAANILSAVVLCVAHSVIHIWELYVADTAAAFAVIGLTTTAMLPLAFYTLCLILQKVPHHMIEQLDKCLREALDIDGVLEFRNERFWTKSFGKLAGTLQVRVRRDANEEHVLETVMKHLSRIVSSLKVQEFRDTRIASTPSDYHPTEYYIEEILELHDRNHDTCTREWDLRWNETICGDVSVIKIDDILGSTSDVGTFASVRGDDRVKCLRIVRNPITYKNNVTVVDHLVKSGSGKGNALILGARGQDDEFDGLCCVKLLDH
ncbi:zinc transporter 6 isoform X2 [Diachasma alloeum]|uniref:zinc transporter 6 isoform X2 n=1 Tax=Diachasma alloeum TaxID=454923 RepID=UPI0007384EB4|nr:zinc transporter 6 isoform X2 [Diachasma alloeum]